MFMMQHKYYGLMMIAGVAMAYACFAFVFCASVARAADLAVSPAVIDGHGLPLDMMHYNLTLTNTSGHQVNVFASVHELTADGQQVFDDPSIANRPALLADWMDVPRGAMMLAPGATTSIPVGITVNPYATAGVYHAVIAFVVGGTRAEAEQNLTGAPQTLVTMTVASNAKETLQLDGFSTEKNFYSGFPVAFDYTIENTGDVPSTPTGNVLLYDRIGHEIGSLDANQSSTAIAPGTKQDFRTVWQAGPGIGQYKAVLQLSYGATGATLSNTVLFWMLPWRRILTIFTVLLVVVIAAAVLLHRAYERRHRRRRRAIERLLENRGVRHDRTVVDLRQPHHDHE